jgi:hypothetical protein
MLTATEEVTISSANIRAILGGAGWKIADSPDSVVLDMLAQHLREHEAMKNVIWQTLRFAQAYGHEA